MRYLSYIVLSFLFLLSGCGLLCGNGDGYCGRGDKTRTPAPDTTPAPTLVSTSYYWNEDGFTCTDHESGLPLASHRDKIVFDGVQYVSTGTLCDPTETVLDTADITTSDEGILYDGNLYVERD